MAVLFSNNASSNLSASITSTATSLSVSAGTGAEFPNPGGSDYFYATISNAAGDIEIIKVTARSTDTLTIVRGQDGTTARAWANSDKIELRLTAGGLSDLKNDTLALVNNGQLTVSAGAGLSGSGTFLANQSSNTSITISHADTSAQASVSNTGATVVQSVTVDTYGHVTAMASKTMGYADVGAPSTTGTNASGTWGISISGNAATVTNGLTTTNYTTYLDGRYRQDNAYIDFTVDGDANTYYPVLISGSLSYGWGVYHITRGYSWTAPDTWYTSTHKGGLTLTFRWSGDTGWGGNDHRWTVEEFSETYSSMVGGMVLTTSGMVVFLRGGTAQYRYYSPAGDAATATVYLSGYTASNSTVYAVRTSNSGNSEVYAQYPVQSNTLTLNASNYTNYTPTKTGSGASGTWGISVTGNAATATTLQTARTINGVSFNGSANITIADDTKLPLSGGTVSGIVRINNQLQVGQNTNGTAIIDAFSGVARFGRDSTSYGLQLDGNNYASFYNANGFLTLGPLNTSYCHFQTDRSQFYFNKQLVVDGNIYQYSTNYLYLNSGNYNSYAPTLTGGGASGTWGISITGNAATATSAVNADTVDGYHASTTRNSANTIPVRDGNGYLQLGWINTTSGDNGTTAIDRVYASNDGYIRYYTPANFRTVLDVPTRGGSGAYGTWNISITGNAGTVSGLNPSQLFNNMGNSHNTYTDFNNVPSFGTYYVQAGTNSPTGVGAHQWYGFTLGLGNEYPLSSYGTQVYWPRAAQNSDTYIYIRDREGGVWGSWRKTKSGYSDSAGTATQLTSPNGTSVVSGDATTALPSSPASLIHTLATGPSGNDGHILGMTWTGTGAYGAQIWLDTDPTSRMAVRSRSSTGTWASWREVLTDGNYNDYAPTKTGGGASGTWGINITGNAATATTLQTARTIQGVSFNGSANITVVTASNGISVSGTAVSIASAYSPNTAFEIPSAVDLNTYQTAGFYYQTANADASAGSNYPEASAGSLVVQKSAGVTQQYYTYQGGGNSMWFRAYYNGTWGAWYKVLSSSNYNSYSPTLTGGGASGTWGINITGNAATATTLQTARTINGVSFNGSANITITAAASDVYSWAKASTKPSYTYTEVGAPSTTGTGASGTWSINITGSAGSASSATLSSQVSINYNNNSNSTYQMLWGSGNSVYGTASIYCNPYTNTIYAAAIQATSDETLKTNWRDLEVGFVERLAETKHGVFDWIENGETDVGVSAQSLSGVLAAAVKPGKDGKLTVNYGNAALVSAVELAKRVVSQDAKIARLEALIEKLIGD